MYSLLPMPLKNFPVSPLVTFLSNIPLLAGLVWVGGFFFFYFSYVNLITEAPVFVFLNSRSLKKCTSFKNKLYFSMYCIYILHTPVYTLHPRAQGALGDTWVQAGQEVSRGQIRMNHLNKEYCSHESHTLMSCFYGLLLNRCNTVMKRNRPQLQWARVEGQRPRTCSQIKWVTNGLRQGDDIEAGWPSSLHEGFFCLFVLYPFLLFVNRWNDNITPKNKGINTHLHFNCVCFGSCDINKHCDTTSPVTSLQMLHAQKTLETVSWRKK